MNNVLSSQGAQTFEALKLTNEHGAEYWSARDLQGMLGYSQWRRFEDAIKRAMTSCETSGNNADYHFAGAGKPITGGKGAIKMSAYKANVWRVPRCRIQRLVWWPERCSDQGP